MYNPSTTVLALAALRKKYIKSFRQLQALNPESAINPEIHGIKRGPVFSSLIRQKILIPAADNLFYLDSERQQYLHHHYRKRALVTIAVMVIIMTVIIMILFTRKAN